MPNRILLSLLLFICLTSCLQNHDSFVKTTGRQASSDFNPVPSIKILAQPIPSVKEAILQAVDATKENSIFTNRIVEIASSRLTDNSVRVLFSVPISDVIVTDGRLATKPIFNVIFTTQATNKEPEEEINKSFQRQSSKLASESLAHAASIALALIPESEPTMEFAISVSKEHDDYLVSIQNIPYSPGGHGVIKVSTDFKVLDIIPGQ